MLQKADLNTNSLRSLWLLKTYLACCACSGVKYILGQMISRLRVVPLSVCSSCMTRKKTARKKWPRELLGARGLRGHFFLAVFFPVTNDVLSERGTTRSLSDFKLGIFSLAELW